ncbi:hypothetical protein OIU84_004680 [Salix udensis]|uniref:Uncharacterized protein n=1 Tax=Salix udensis TaxID=889485 RepID=A0AAD6K2U0_9ROSI|nr:hypothetical protein OIU84_004680 [Salix udensis]
MVFVASNNFFLEGRDKRKKALCVTSPSAPLPLSPVRTRLSLCNKNLKQQQMQLRESIHSTKKLFHNTIQNLKSIFFGGYQKLTKHSSFNPFSCGSGNVRNHQTGQYYEDFFNELECDLEKAMNRKSSSLMGSEEPVRDEDKMKELEMMDVSNVEHVLDVEEALHYYSRLKSPVYQDIVDEFFTDMYTEFSVPQAAASINSSKRRIESIRL